MPDSAMVEEQETLILQTLEQFLERDVRPHVMELEHSPIGVVSFFFQRRGK